MSKEMERQNENVELILFLRNLSDLIERKELLPSQLKSVSDFFLSYTFKEQNLVDESNFEENFDKQDLIKFVSLGWYVYQILLKDNELPIQHN